MCALLTEVGNGVRFGLEKETFRDIRGMVMMTRYPKAVVDEWVEFSISASTKIQVEEALISYTKLHPRLTHEEIRGWTVWRGSVKPPFGVVGTRPIEGR